MNPGENVLVALKFSLWRGFYQKTFKKIPNQMMKVNDRGTGKHDGKGRVN